MYGVWFYFLTIIRLLWFIGIRMIFVGLNVVKEYRNNYVATSKDIMKGKRYFYLDAIGVEPCTKGKGYAFFKYFENVSFFEGWVDMVLTKNQFKGTELHVSKSNSRQQIV